MSKNNLPSWQDFRERRDGESEIAYLMSFLHDTITQNRQRDHWIVNELWQPLVSDMDRMQLMLLGDPTLHIRGALTTLTEGQDAMRTELAEQPERIRRTIEQSNTIAVVQETRRRRQWWQTTLQLGVGGAAGSLIVILLPHILKALTGG